MVFKEKVAETLLKRSEAADYGIRLPASQYCSHLCAFCCKISFHTLDDDTFLAWTALDKLQFTAPALLSLFALLLHEVVLPLRIELLAVKHLKVAELNDKRNADPLPVISAEAGLCLKDHQPCEH